jgi:hypothetical protein
MGKTAIKAETANQITANIIRIINFQPRCAAHRLNNVGVWDEKKQVHRKGNTEKGLPDIIACIRGLCVWIEVKAGKDRQSEDQKKRQFEIEKAGGFYLIARSTDDFIHAFNDLLK